MTDHDGKMHEDIGYIRGIVEGIDKKVEKQNSSMAKLSAKVSRHEVILGKVGIMLTAGVFLLTLVFNTVAQWVKMKLS